MSALVGTNIGAPIVMSDSADTYPTHLAQYGKGGIRSAADATARDAISIYRREEGMMVYLQDTDKVYYLKDGIANANWVEWTGGAGAQGVTGLPGASGPSGSQGVTGLRGLTGAFGPAGLTGTVGDNEIAFGNNGGLTSSSNINTGTSGSLHPNTRWLNVNGRIATNSDGDVVDNGGLSLSSGITGANGYPHMIGMQAAFLNCSLSTLPTINVYAVMGPHSYSTGGLHIDGYGTGVFGLVFCGFAAVGDQTVGTGRYGAVLIDTAKQSGTSRTALASNEHVLSIRNNSSTIASFAGNGDMALAGDLYVNSSQYGTASKVAYGGGSTGGTTTANGTVTLTIDGTSYYLLKAAAA